MTSRKALGKGLGALIGESRAALARAGEAGGGEGRLRELPIAEITVNRRQPRRAFAEADLAELASSIKALGVVQPVVVRPLSVTGTGTAAETAVPAVAPSEPIPAEPTSAEPILDTPAVPAPSASAPAYELIAGERRLRAAKLAGLTRIPALVRPADEATSLEIALAENVAREDLNSIEEAQAYAALIDEFGLTHERVAELVGRSRAAVTNLLRLLELPDEVQRLIEGGELSEGHGRALLGLPDHGERRTGARLVLTRGLNVRQTEALVKKLAGRRVSTGGVAEPSAAEGYDALVDELYGVLEAPVRIRRGKRGGTIQIAFKDREEFERLVGLLRSLGA